MYASIRRYQVRGAWDEELTNHLTDGFIPIIKEAPGFIAYYALDPGAGQFASVSVFETREGAEESNRMAADYVKQHLADRFTGSPDITAGEVRAHT
jgi:heme-degrading monooxygenase HmoA